MPYPQKSTISDVVGRKIEGPAFAQMIVDHFDEMLEQSAHEPLVMGIALHPISSASPSMRHLRRALTHVAKQRDRIWLTTAGAIAAHVWATSADMPRRIMRRWRAV